MFCSVVKPIIYVSHVCACVCEIEIACVCVCVCVCMYVCMYICFINAYLQVHKPNEIELQFKVYLISKV